jgi:copper chaperone CopZ
VQKALETLPWVRKVQVDFAKEQAVVTVETEKYDEKALVRALEKAGYGGKVIKPSASQPHPSCAAKSTKAPGGKKIDLDRQIVFSVQGLT